MFVARDLRHLALAVGDCIRRDLAGKPAVGDRPGRAVLAAHGEGVLILTRNLSFLGEVFRRLSHGVDAVG